jgi:hypothetical protein
MEVWNKMKDPFNHMDEALKYAVDALSLVTVIGTLVDMLPSIAAVFTIVWTAIRIYETKTVQGWMRKENAE